jgi:hypothetical protein
MWKASVEYRSIWLAEVEINKAQTLHRTRLGAIFRVTDHPGASRLERAAALPVWAG